MPVPATIASEQTMQVGASGPGDVTALHVVCGIANAGLGAFVPAGGGFQAQQATFAVQVGPVLTNVQFRKAIATASLASLSLQGAGAASGWAVTGVDADFDDDTGRVELRFDVSVQVSAGAAGGVNAAVAGVGFQVLILST